MIYPWKLKYWQTGEWQVVNERLRDMEKANVRYNPKRSELFRSLQQLRPEAVRVMVLGQDPYPDARFATGTAFSIPTEIPEGSYPQTLKAIFKEYQTDLGYPTPSSGDLSAWTQEGILLWNVIPSTEEGKSLSHDWDEWSYLTREIIDLLSERGGIVFAFLGSVARRYETLVDIERNKSISVSHPSPRGSLNSRTPFVGSCLFTTINRHLAELGKPEINWRLDRDAESDRNHGQEGAQRTGLV